MLAIGLLLPLFGTMLGAACVFFLKRQMSEGLERILNGFAAGVMVAASVWGLLLPALEQSNQMGKLSFIPASVGFLLGVFFLLLLDHTIPHLHLNSQAEEGMKKDWAETTKLLLAVTLHNIPEGIAVGIVFAEMLEQSRGATMSAAFALSLGIAIQNFPEGAIISMPLITRGMSKSKAFFCGTLSGVVEPLAAVMTILLAHILVPVLPYLLSFAAGAMLYVVVEELIPEMAQGGHSNTGVVSFSFGFVLMMILDVALG